MNEEQAKSLRAEFPASAIGQLPKPTNKDNPKGTCKECGKWHGLPAVHLDYVGHAATTDRLLSVDPDWTWEPMALGANGEPLMTNGGLWIKLTVCGVTRPGFGDGNSMKEVIGDAIRNAAMRFGVALDLWAKEDLHADDSQTDAKAKTEKAAEKSGSQKTQCDAVATEVEQKKLTRLAANLNEVKPLDWDKVIAQFAQQHFGCAREALTSAQVLAIAKELPKQLDSLDKAKLRDLQKAAA